VVNRERKTTIVIIDYGMGNLRSVQKAFEKVGQPAVVVDDPSVIAGADGVVLPGVGAFRDAISSLSENGLADEVRLTISSGKPFLGICLGLDLLFSWSEEDGLYEGLDIIKGRVVRLPDTVKVPHIGWNQIHKKKENPLLEGIPENTSYYFVHSYVVQPEDSSVIATTTDYGMEFVSSIWRDNVFAVQFHPEKSSLWGLKILSNFGEIVRTSGSREN
jgi:glutamine amidotransferase